MNKPSEQIDAILNVFEAADQPLKSSQQEVYLKKYLGEENCKKEVINGKKVFVYNNGNGKKIILLYRNITYLGGNGQHPAYKKRIQLPQWFKDFCQFISDNNMGYDVRFLGIYHYDGLILFADFLKETYLKKMAHNSSAHICINDLAQGLKYGLFHKEDKYGNHINVIKDSNLQDYLDKKPMGSDMLFNLFTEFNNGFSFGRWLTALDVIKGMYDAKWPKWKEAEWAGFFLEYKFDKFTQDANITDRMRYISKKRAGQLDFDILFGGIEKFYGDLKASDIAKREAPANDRENVMECIHHFGRLWYIIYEHETRKDSEFEYQQTKARNQFIRGIDKKYKKSDMSYSQRMKNSVKFVKMSILEINKINCRLLLKEFSQGHQSDGKARKPKFAIKKRDMDNFVVFRYCYRKQE